MDLSGDMPVKYEEENPLIKEISQAHREVRIIKRKNKSEMTISAKEN